MRYYSKTGYQKGYGSALFKRVYGLTKKEQEMVKAGKKVYIKGSRPAGGNHGTTERLVIYTPSYGYQPRVPSDKTA